MPSQMASPSLRGEVATWRAPTHRVARHRGPPRSASAWRYLPLALLTTALVVALPAALASAIVPRGSTAMIVASGLLAVALSMAIATAAAAIWKRQPHSRDVLFADLLLWGWLRRRLAEQRLSQARSLFDSAHKSGPSVSIELVTGLSRLLEARDAYTHRHGQRVARDAGMIARAMGLPPVEIAKIKTAAAVHDVGKLYTPQEILNNPNRLSEAEYEVAKRHAAWGARMLCAVGDEDIVAMVRHHHERIDGNGYPDGLAGSEIPLGARIIAVADTFDAITSNRAYRSGCTQKRALDVLASEAGTQLDTAAVAAFAALYSSRRSVAGLSLLTAAPGRILAALQAASQSVLSGASGLGSILPGIGAAGLLAVSPGLHHTARPAAHSPSVVSHALGRPASAGALALHRSGRHTTPTRGVGFAHHPRERAVARVPGRPGAGNTGLPSSPGRAPAPAQPRPTGRGSSPPPSGAPPSPPPVIVPTVPNAPAPPTPPVSVPSTPPVSVPNLPAIPPPPVQVPSVPPTGITPAVGVPVATG